MLKNLSVVYFSPTGGTKKAALLLARGLAEQICEIDLSLPGQGSHVFGKGDTVLFAMPVFGGRLPAYGVERLKQCTGDGTVCITAAVYGNRAFEDALVELNDCVKAQGFQVLAATALLAEHSMVRAVAAGRPDEQDSISLHQFAEKILAKLEDGQIVEASVPGNRPYKDWTPMPVVPQVSDRCIRCGICAKECPTQAIPASDPATTDPAKCMLCVRCIAVCPHQARVLPGPAQAMLEQKLLPLKEIRRENELFL